MLSLKAPLQFVKLVNFMLHICLWICLSLCVYVHVHAVSSYHRLLVIVRGQPWIINFHCVCTVVCRDICVEVREQLVGVSSVCHVAFCDELRSASLAWSAFFYLRSHLTDRHRLC